MNANENETVLSVFRKQVAVSMDSVMAAPAALLFASGIVNPFGPTIECFVAVGPFSAGATQRVVRLILNPFQVESAQVGALRLGTNWDPIRVFSQLIPLHARRACPTLIHLHHQVAIENATSLIARFLACFPDGRRVYECVRRFYGNPWDRVSFEMESAAEEAVRAVQGQNRPLQPLQESEVWSLAEMLLAAAHFRLEVQAFLTAWQGAIEHAAQPGAVVLPLKAFQAIMRHIREKRPS